MKDFDNSFLTLITADEAAVFWCVDLQISTGVHHYHTTLDIDIVHDGNRYETSEFTITPVNYGMGMGVDKIRLEFANVSLVMSAALLNYTVTGQPVRIYAGAMNGFTPVIEEVFRGLASEWTLDEHTADITVVDEFVWWNKRTLRKPDALCPWEFKGTECGYAGAQTLCNRSWARCSALGNTASFGGFKYFPVTEEKEVWWGKGS